MDNLHRNQRMNPRGGSGGAIRQGPEAQGGLGKKSNSTSQLSAAGNDALKNLIILQSKLPKNGSYFLSFDFQFFMILFI